MRTCDRDAHELQFADASIALVYTNVLDHIRNTSVFAREAHRVLRPNGTLWIEIDQNKPDEYSVHDLRKERLNIVRQFSGQRKHGLSPLFSTLTETLLTHAGCSDTAIARVQNVHGACESCPRLGWHLKEPGNRQPQCIDWNEKDTPKFIYLFRKQEIDHEA